MADLSRFVNATEYLRRNSAHANAVGAHANTKAALTRLLTMKRPPMWLVAALEGIERRTAIVHPEVAAWRNSAPDNPYGVLASPKWCPECRSAGVVGIEQDVCPTCDGLGIVAAGVDLPDGAKHG